MEKVKRQPKISVMLLTYNRDKLLPRAIKSALNQTFGNFELVIVNNAATDTTEAVIQSFLGDPRIVYRKHEKNTGPFGGLNTCLDLVTGEYVLNLADDDELVPNALETISDAIDRLSPRGIQIIYFDSIDAEVQQYSGSGIKKEGPVAYEDYLCNRFNGDYQVVMARSVIGNNRFDQNAWGGMTTTYGLRCHRGNLAYYVPKIIAKLYRLHGESRITRAETTLYHHLPKMLGTLESFLGEFGEEIKKACPANYGERLASLGFYQILNGRSKEGRVHLATALKFRFSVFHAFVYVASFALTAQQIKSLCLIFFNIRERLVNLIKKFKKPVALTNVRA